LEAAQPGGSFLAAFQAVRSKTVGKIIFTSGSTGVPKGVINTHGNLCTATAAVGQMFPWLDDDYVMVDWLPWNHSLGGTANMNGVLHNGGTMYIDGGRPLPGEFDQTIWNLTDISPSYVQNVPAAYQMLTEAMERNDALRKSFFRRVQYLSYTGASLPQETWDRMQALAVRTIGKRIAFVSAWGATEAGPGISSTHWFGDGKGQIGLPMASFDIKLVPLDDRYEARVRGPAVTPGYLGNPNATEKAFDEEGFYRVGDALRFVDPENPEIGLQFAGRASENFKLASGTFVNVGALRLAVLSATAPLLRDVVIAGEGRGDVRILAWPSDSGCADLRTKSDMPLHEDHSVIDAVRNALIRHNEQFPNASRRIAAFHLLDEPPSLGRGETTDKGYINQRGVLSVRASLAEELYVDPTPARVIVV
jgi:feruloyl-CoA synthase